MAPNVKVRLPRWKEMRWGEEEKEVAESSLFLVSPRNKRIVSADCVRRRVVQSSLPIERQQWPAERAEVQAAAGDDDGAHYEVALA